MTTFRTSTFASRTYVLAGFGLWIIAACGGENSSRPMPDFAAGSFAPAGTGGATVNPAGEGADAPMPAPAAGSGNVAAGGFAPAPRAGMGGATTPPVASAGAPSEAPNPGIAGTPAADSGGTAGAADSGNAPTPPAADSCLAGITGFDKAGPFRVESRTQGAVKLFVPQVPAGCKVPVTHLANGTGGTCAAYSMVHQRLASHGFLATCYESTQTGAGTQGVMAIDTAFKQYPELADKRIGSTGHSQGGQAAFVVLQLAEAKWGPEYVYAGLAMQPASGFGDQPAGGTWQSVYAKIKSPMFMFSGTSDVLVSESWVQRGFAALDDGIEAYNWSAVGATHVPTPQAATMQVAVAWFRWKLLGDKAACEYFKALPAGRDWDERTKQNEKPCE